MKSKMFAVKDAKVGEFLQPFRMRTTAEAVRAFMDLVADKDTQFHRHPEDFFLCELGEWDSESGLFENKVPPVVLGSANDYHPRYQVDRQG